MPDRAWLLGAVLTVVAQCLLSAVLLPDLRRRQVQWWWQLLVIVWLMPVSLVWLIVVEPRRQP